MFQDSWIKYSVFIAMVLALFVVTLGAYTRLTDAGLGCPDWPGCYGHMVLPQQTQALQAAQATYPDIPVEQGKAWTEMAHRYVAGCLAILIAFIGGRALFLRYRHDFRYWRLPMALISLVGFQAALGMWTVTMKLLPVVVMSHLLGGITIFAILSYYTVKLSNPGEITLSQWFFWVVGGIILLYCQIALGGWVSANYAGIACVGFPTCNGQWLPALHLGQGFNLFSPVGENYQGGLLSSAIRVTIQMIHRFGALIVSIYLIGLAVALLCSGAVRTQRVCAWFILMLLVIQIGLSITNVLYLLPLPAAVAHNGVAAMLLASLMAMLYLVTNRRAYAR